MPARAPFYERLGIDATASSDEIKRAYHALALRLHPDRGGDKTQFQSLQQAWETLRDPDRRRLYDLQHAGDLDTRHGAPLFARDWPPPGSSSSFPRPSSPMMASWAHGGPQPFVFVDTLFDVLLAGMQGFAATTRTRRHAPPPAPAPAPAAPSPSPSPFPASPHPSSFPFPQPASSGRARPSPSPLPSAASSSPPSQQQAQPREAAATTTIPLWTFAAGSRARSAPPPRRPGESEDDEDDEDDDLYDARARRRAEGRPRGGEPPSRVPAPDEWYVPRASFSPPLRDQGPSLVPGPARSAASASASASSSSLGPRPDPFADLARNWDLRASPQPAQAASPSPPPPVHPPLPAPPEKAASAAPAARWDRRGEDLNVVVPVTLADLASGATQRVRIARAWPCDLCRPEKEEPRAGGCVQCGGTRRMEKRSYAEIRVFADADLGQPLVVDDVFGDGEPPQRLVVQLSEKPHPRFTRDRQHLVARVLVPPAASLSSSSSATMARPGGSASGAALGSALGSAPGRDKPDEAEEAVSLVTLAHVDERVLRLAVRGRVRAGDVRMLPGRGLPCANGSTGNLYLVFVDPPGPASSSGAAPSEPHAAAATAEPLLLLYPNDSACRLP